MAGVLLVEWMLAVKGVGMLVVGMLVEALLMEVVIMVVKWEGQPGQLEGRIEGMELKE